MKDKIVLDNLGLINKAIKDLNCRYRNQDEFEAYYYAGLIGLIKASKTYNSEKGKSTYLYKSIERRIKTVFDYNSNSRRNNGKIPISLNTEIKDMELMNIIASDYNLEKEVINKILIEDTLNKLKNKRYKKFIIEYYGINQEALNMQEIALKYGVSKQCVQQSIQWGLKLMRKEIK